MTQINIREMEGYKAPPFHSALEYRAFCNPCAVPEGTFLNKKDEASVNFSRLKDLLEDEFLSQSLAELVEDSEDIALREMVRLLCSRNANDLKNLAQSTGTSTTHYFLYKAMLEVAGKKFDPELEHLLLDNLALGFEEPNLVERVTENLSESHKALIDTAYQLIVLSAEGYEDPKSFDYTVKRGAKLTALSVSLAELSSDEFKVKRLLRALQLGLKAPNDSEWLYKFVLAWVRNEYDQKESNESFYYRMLGIL